MVEVVRFFNGNRDEAKVVGRARTMSGIRRLEAQAPRADGWGCEVRGAKDELVALGAWDTGVGWALVLDEKKDRLIGCIVQ